MASPEFDLITRYFTRPAANAVLGVGDDCALLLPTPGCELAVTTDTLVEGRHFFPDVDPRSLGHKALAVNLSDAAAMGADPKWITLALTLPAIDHAWLAAFSAGLCTLADQHGVSLVGGDTTRGPLSVTITVLAEVPRGQALRRDGAKIDDDIWVSGTLGAPLLAVEQRYGKATLTRDAFAKAAHTVDWPEPQLALGRALRGVARSAIDISDGLVGDLAHICERSSLGAVIEAARVPASPLIGRVADESVRLNAALTGGDEYQLCFTAAPSARHDVAAIGARLGLLLTRIGSMRSGQGVTVVDAYGASIPLVSQGFDHFAA